MTRWEYARLDLASISANETEVALLNRAGESGWELVAITGNNMALLKRPLPPPPKTRASTKPSSTATSSTGQ